VFAEDRYEEDTYPGALAPFDLVGGPQATGVIPFVLSGQGMGHPRRYV